MKAKIINGEIKRYSEMPKYFKNWAGSFNTQSNEIHEQNGFFDVVNPEIDSDTEERDGQIFFDNVKKVFTWLVKNKTLPTLTEAKELKIRELKDAVKGLYTDVQAYVIEKQIHGETIPVVVKNKIKSIRTNYNSIKDEINALNTVVVVIRFKLPYNAIKTLREKLSNIE